jgi:hypothetical protein
MNSNHRESMAPQRKAEKKNYAPPKFLVYGDIRDVTKAVGNMGATDGGGPPNQKTSA